MSLRNLDLANSLSRIRGKTITDDDAPYNLESPTKRALRSEARKLTHASSFTNLADANKDRPSSLQKTSTSYSQDGTASLARPVARMRRRSTLHWNSASPRARQDKLRDLTAHRLVDTWFTLHMTRSSEPIYASEVMERSMNPSFAFFDLDALEPEIARADACALRVWAKGSDSDDWAVLVEINLNLRSLHFVGKTLDSFHHPLPENCVLLHLSDGVYTSFTDLPGRSSSEIAQADSRTELHEASSSFDALMQLANLDECIQDAARIRTQLENDVNELLLAESKARERHQSILRRRDDLDAAHVAVEGLRKQNTHLQRRIDELRRNLKARRESLRRADQPDATSADVEELHHNIRSTNNLDQGLSDERHGQLRRIGEALLITFPIEPVKNKALHFTIRDIYLPNSTFDDTNRDEIAAALGFTTQLVQQLASYLRCALPYPVDASSSQSWIEDPISAGLAQRRFPLHPTNVAYKFEYGVFLLNKNIETLMSKIGLRVLDIRHTLPNLKFLLYVLTAGSGELPTRKSGGIKGLIGGRLSPSMSRRTSEDSVQGGRELLKSVQGNGAIAGKEKPADAYLSTRLAYRQSTLRESS